MAANKFTPKQRAEIKEALHDIFEKLRETDKVTVQGYGSFKIVDLKARKIRSIKTGEMIKIPEHTVVRFHESSSLKKTLPRRTKPATRKAAKKRRRSAKRSKK